MKQEVKVNYTIYSCDVCGKELVNESKNISEPCLVFKFVCRPSFSANNSFFLQEGKQEITLGSESVYPAISAPSDLVVCSKECLLKSIEGVL